MRTNEWGGHLAGMASEEMDEPLQIPAAVPARQVPAGVRPARRLVEHRRQRLGGQHLLDPARAAGRRDSGRDVTEADFLQPGAQQVAAGYAHLRPVHDAGAHAWATASHGFTLDPQPRRVRAHATRTSECRDDTQRVRHQRLEQPLLGAAGQALRRRVPGRQDRPARQGLQHALDRLLVAETHRILMRGGVFMYPRDTKDPAKPGRLRLLYEANPIGS